MKLDPEEQIIAAAFDQAELDYANERGVAARIEFRPEGHAKVTFTISREFVRRPGRSIGRPGNSSPRRSG